MRSQVSEEQFRKAITIWTAGIGPNDFDFVLGAGRSGAIAAVYASHLTGIPFVAWNNRLPENSKVLIIDTAKQSGKTLRRAVARYNKLGHEAVSLPIYECDNTHFIFWYERDYTPNPNKQLPN